MAKIEKEFRYSDVHVEQILELRSKLVEHEMTFRADFTWTPIQIAELAKRGFWEADEEGVLRPCRTSYCITVRVVELAGVCFNDRLYDSRWSCRRYWVAEDNFDACCDEYADQAPAKVRKRVQQYATQWRRARYPSVTKEVPWQEREEFLIWKESLDELSWELFK